MTSSLATPAGLPMVRFSCHWVFMVRTACTATRATITWRGVVGGDLLHGDAGADMVWGDAAAVNVAMLAPDVAATAWGDDVLDGGAGDDTLIGGGWQ